MNNTVFDIKKIKNEKRRNEISFLESGDSFKIKKIIKKLDQQSFYKDLFIKIKEMYFNTDNNIISLVVTLSEYIRLKDGNTIKNDAKEANLYLKQFIDDRISIIHMLQMNHNFHLNETNVIIDIGWSKTWLYLLIIKNYEYIIIDLIIEENLDGREFDKKLIKKYD